MSALKKQFHEYLVECSDCMRNVKRCERCECGAPTRMIDRVNETLKRAHGIAPVIVRKAK